MTCRPRACVSGTVKIFLLIVVAFDRYLDDLHALEARALGIFGRLQNNCVEHSHCGAWMADLLRSELPWHRLFATHLCRARIFGS